MALICCTHKLKPHGKFGTTDMNAPQHTPLLLPAISVAAGCVIARWIWASTHYASLWTASLLIAAAAICLAFLSSHPRRTVKWVYIKGYVDASWVFLLFFSIAMMAYRINAPSRLDLENEVFPPIAVGIVEQSSQLSACNEAIVKINKFHDYEGKNILHPENLRVTLYTDALPLQPGEIIAWPHELKKSNTTTQWAQYVPDSNITILPQKIAWRHKLNHLRHELITKIEKSHLHKESASFLMATLLGYRDNLTEEATTLFRTGGMSHLLALSGMHIAIILVLLNFLTYPVQMLSRKWRYLITILLLWGYIAITGFPTTAVRAAIMASMILLSWITERKNAAFNALLASIICIVLIDGEAITSPGFQLSVAATASIIYFAHHLNPFDATRHRCVNIIYNAIGMSAIALLTTSILTAYHFHTIAPTSLVANIITCAIMPFYLGLALLQLMISLMSVEWGFLNWLLNAISDVIHHLASRSAALPLNGIDAKLSAWSVALIFCAMICMAKYFTSSKRIYPIAGAASLCGAFIMMVFFPPQSEGNRTMLIRKHGLDMLEVTIHGQSYNMELPKSHWAIYEIGHERMLWLDTGGELPSGKFATVVIGENCGLSLADISRYATGAQYFGGFGLHSHQIEDYAAEAHTLGIKFTHIDDDYILPLPIIPE